MLLKLIYASIESILIIVETILSQLFTVKKESIYVPDRLYVLFPTTIESPKQSWIFWVVFEVLLMAILKPFSFLSLIYRFLLIFLPKILFF